MKFSYTALTKDNKKITGILDTGSQEAAQAELHKMGVAIIAINKISEKEYEKLKKEQKAVREKKGIQTFNFLAVDPNKKEIEGTIDAVDDFSAYKRLRTEYKFKVTDLHLTKATEAEKETAKGTLLNFETRLEEELAASKEEKKGGGEEMEEEINKNIIAEVDKVIINTKKTLKDCQNLFSNELLSEIKKTLDELERIRISNNIKHITEVSNDLYSLLSNPDKGDKKDIQNNKYQSLIGEIKDNPLVKKEFELYKKAVKLSGAKKVLGSITKRLKQLTETSKEEEEKAGLITRIKFKIHAFLEKLTKKKKDEKSEKSDTAETPVQDAEQAGDAVGTQSDEALAKADASTDEKAEEKPKPALRKDEKKKHDFTKLFVEIDSFIGWLLCFYIIYFFSVNFSLEKNIGLKSEFVFKTLKTPLLLNIIIFLLLIHFTQRIKNLHFRQNALAAFFLIALSLGAYTLLVVNF